MELEISRICIMSKISDKPTPEEKAKWFNPDNFY